MPNCMLISSVQGLWIPGVLQKFQKFRPRVWKCYRTHACSQSRYTERTGRCLGHRCVWLVLLPGANAPRDDVTQCVGIGLISCQTYRSVLYRYRCGIDTGTVPVTYMHAGTAVTGIDVVPLLPKFPVVPVLTSYHTFRRVQYR